MATENIMMHAVKMGGDRQELHEKIRVHSMEAGKRVKVDGEENDLIDRIVADPSFNITREEIESVLRPENYVGRAPKQTEEFLSEVVKPILDKNRELLGLKVELSV